MTQENPNFIGNWNIEDDKLCQKIITFFENNPKIQIKGTTSGGVDEKVKKSTDITINPSDLKNKEYELFNEYFEKLYGCFTDYKDQYPFLKTFLKKIHIGPFNIQKYLKGDHFAKLHSERTDISSIHRIFAWMTYLNDVEDGGGTHFRFQNLTTKSKKGLTLLWPSDFTHMHNGIVSPTEHKYIATGWFNYLCGVDSYFEGVSDQMRNKNV